MLEFFYILTKGGLILWCIPSKATGFIKIINNVIDTAILQGQGSTQKWIADSSPYQIHYKLDNEFEIIFILGYHKTLNISYADKFLDEIQKRFRDQYKNDLLAIDCFKRSFPFRGTYQEVLSEIEKEEKVSRQKLRPNVDVLSCGQVHNESNLWSKLKKMNIFTSKVLTSDDLRLGMETIREQLIAKNVAANVADKICESIATKMIGKTLESFESLTTTIRQALRDTLMTILTPKRQIDILRDVASAQQKGRPYVITICGVNGVGKTTNLAKIAYWLGGNNLRILIAACDTFRSGAIEQLRTHVSSLNNIFNEQSMIELYARDYGKDPANVAAQAINFAKVNKFDVVLIDTAGRMENNEPLMKALAKLIHMNKPDLVLFVGEALVGNSGVDQITQFNQALIKNTPLNRDPRSIDGIILTKFDAVNDKVGAAISMTYTTDKPIIFVGTGQRCQDLKIINSDVVTEILLQ